MPQPCRLQQEPDPGGAPLDEAAPTGRHPGRGESASLTHGTSDRECIVTAHTNPGVPPSSPNVTKCGIRRPWRQRPSTTSRSTSRGTRRRCCGASRARHGSSRLSARRLRYCILTMPCKHPRPGLESHAPALSGRHATCCSSAAWFTRAISAWCSCVSRY